MHEVGLVKDILESVQREASLRPKSNVSSITVQVGKHTGYEPDHIVECFCILKKDFPNFQNTRMLIEEKETYAFCNSCNIRFISDDEISLCPSCGALSAIDMQDALILKSIQLKKG